MMSVESITVGVGSGEFCGGCGGCGLGRHGTAAAVSFCLRIEGCGSLRLRIVGGEIVD
mgnify:CR=1 FL=1